MHGWKKFAVKLQRLSLIEMLMTVNNYSRAIKLTSTSEGHLSN